MSDKYSDFLRAPQPSLVVWIFCAVVCREDGEDEPNLAIGTEHIDTFEPGLDKQPFSCSCERGGIAGEAAPFSKIPSS